MRILKAPAALVVVAELLVLPSAYSWYNIRAFWNPYGNTAALSVCVVNQDAGGDSELTGSVDIGAQIVEALHQNTQLN